MNEICERALECYIKKLEKDNETLRDFANTLRTITFDFDGAKPDISDKDIVNNVRNLVRAYDGIFKEE